MALKVVGSSPTNHPLIKTFLKKLFKKKILKKKVKNFILVNNYIAVKAQQVNSFNSAVFICKINTKLVHRDKTCLLLFNLNQKKFNTKNTISTKKTLNTFSIGSVIKYFNLKQGKSVRRNQKGLKVFLNFLKNIFLKKYQQNNLKHIFTINGFDYNLLFLRNFLFRLIQNHQSPKEPYLLFKINIPHTTLKLPKKKSIKKKINKNILSSFLKNNKQINF